MCLYLYTSFQIERSTISAFGFTVIEVNINDNKILAKMIFTCKSKAEFPQPKPLDSIQSSVKEINVQTTNKK